MSYKQNAAASRNALFGSAPSRSRNSQTKSRNITSTTNASRPVRSNNTYQRSTAAGATSNPMNPVSSIGKNYSNRFAMNKTAKFVNYMSGAEKEAKMKEAEKFRLDAKMALTRGLFTKPDPVLAGSYYKRAADTYKLCGENRLERLHRIASADCQRGDKSYAVAASEYTRAAELAELSDETVGRKRNEAYQLHKNAAEAYFEIDEIGRQGESLMRAAMALLIDAHPDDPDAMDKKFHTILAEAIEIYVPDPVNRFNLYRKYGTSPYKPEDNHFATIAAARKLAYENIRNSPYAHETISKAVYTLVDFGEIHAALYALGAVSALLEDEKTATISLSRAYFYETVLQLSLKDIVAANKTFMEVHLQSNSYLKSRECKFAEELIRAMRLMDVDAWDTAKQQNRYVLVNLDPTMQRLVMNMHLTGAPRRVKKDAPSTTQSSRSANTGNKPSTYTSKTSKTSPDFTVDTQNPSTTQNNFDEMMAIMKEMGLSEDKIDVEEYSKDDSSIDAEEYSMDGSNPEITEVEQEQDLIDLR